MQRRNFLKWISLFSASAALPNLLAACNSQPSAGTSAGETSGQPLTVGVQPWAGFMGQYIAQEKDFFKAEGVTVNEEFFQVATDTNTALAANKVDLAWVGVPDLMTLVEQAPSLKILMLSDYSNGADGILGRSDMNRADDLRGKRVAREDAPYAKIFLGTYLKQAGMSEKDVEIVSLSASDAATAFAAGRVDAATTYEPWLTKTAQESQGQILFTSKDTSIIPNGLAASAETIAARRDDILRYLRAIDRALAFAAANPAEANEICAKKLGVTAAEIPPQLAGIRTFDIKGNKEGPLNPNSPYSLVRSLQSGENIISNLGIISKPVDAASLVDDSLVKSL